MQVPIANPLVNWLATMLLGKEHKALLLALHAERLTCWLAMVWYHQKRRVVMK